MSVVTQLPTKQERIRQLNDRLRTTFQGGRVMKSSAVAGLPAEKQGELFRLVRDFNDFNPENDPYQEHDFGAMSLDNTTWYFKIDYYDVDERFGADDPSEGSRTKRVMTIMHCSEF